MKKKTLDYYLHDNIKIKQLQNDIEKYYSLAKNKHQVVGNYKNREYITLSYYEHMFSEMIVSINWPDQVSPYHVHNWVEMGYMYSGQCDIIVKDEEFTMKEGQFILLDTQVPHQIGKTGGDNILINFAFDKNYLSNNFFNRITKENAITNFFVNTLNEQTNHDKYIIFDTSDNEAIPNIIKSFLCEYYDPSLCSSDILNSYMTIIICELINNYKKGVIKEEKTSLKYALVSILQYIENHCSDCTLEEVANYFHISPNYMTAQLKKYTGYSFKELVQKNRFEQAGRLLINTEKSVRDVANTVGYENMGFFNKKFIKYFGCLPNEYRVLKKAKVDK